MQQLVSFVGYDPFAASTIMSNHLIDLPDALTRQQALDPEQSFIVQAPAGSGKTELLVQRYLMLLAYVRSPEAIIALTFTRKAAAEMRMRILNALENAQHPYCISEKDKTRRQLAQRVLVQDKAMHWHLLDNPNRLRIQTIDSFCQTLTRHMPLLSTLGTQLTPLENPKFLYRLAAQELICSLETRTPWQKALLQVVKHLDNNFGHLETLFSELLANREQWLDYLSSDPNNLRNYLESSLKRIIQQLIAQLNHLTPPNLLQELKALLDFSLHQRQERSVPSSGTQDFWQVASLLLVNKDNTWRKQVTKKEGFPSSKKNKEEKLQNMAMKQRMLQLIRCLQNQPGLHTALIDLKNAPPSTYTESQWTILAALLELLPVLLAHLQLIFQQYKKADYTEILLCALAALSDAGKPTNLVLNLDYQIEHLLIDEFQDTPVAQFQLIERLIAGWQADDGRSLFLVGDPMQSIYRFRKAEVGLFLQVQQQGIANILPRKLTLSVNFRSDPSLIDWTNECFSQLLPAKDNISRGAITFSPVTAFHPQDSKKSIHTYWFDATDASAEAHKIVEIIQQIKQQDSEASIAILVRARSHLLNLLPVLQAASIPYHATQIESLAAQATIQDLLILVRALSHLGDRIAWLALLRSPCCGLNLHDLIEITRFCDPVHPTPCIWQQLICFEQISLKKCTKQRLQRIVPILQQGLQEQGQLPLASWIKKTWIALGGPTTLATPEAVTQVDTFLSYLENKLLTEGEHVDFFKLEEELSQSVVQTTNKPSVACIEIMTIHKAKGLEFDHVILPNLHCKASHDSAKLLLYQEQWLTAPIQIKDFLLAPIKAAHETEDRIYNYLALQEREKAHHELTRLLYVAVTRAKKSLSLLGGLRVNSSGKIGSAHTDSLLHPLWPVVQPSFSKIFCTPTFRHHQDTQSSTPRLIKRLVADWKNPRSSILYTPKNSNLFNSVCYQWTDNPVMAIGTIIHRLLYHISQDGLAFWDKINRNQENTPRFVQWLKQAGIVSAAFNDAVHKLKRALQNTLSDPRGRWILSQEHQDSRSEFAITILKNGTLQNFVIDRTFIDSTGTRWIIDYKTTARTHDNCSNFAEPEMQTYKQQLETYAAALTLNSPNLFSRIHGSIRLGLYFPLSMQWLEWNYIPTAGGGNNIPPLLIKSQHVTVSRATTSCTHKCIDSA